jgi:succinate-acetate transporter protein
MALFYGGLAQFLAGMWEFAAGNTFGATGEYWNKVLSSILGWSFRVGGFIVHLT